MDEPLNNADECRHGSGKTLRYCFTGVVYEVCLDCEALFVRDGLHSKRVWPPEAVPPPPITEYP